MTSVASLPTIPPPPSYSSTTSQPSVFAAPHRPTFDVPLSVINRPLPSVLEEEKVQRFMRDIQAGDDFTPIEVLLCVTPSGLRYYFAFGGCHRFEAHKRLGSATLRGTIINVPPATIRGYLGASCPF